MEASGLIPRNRVWKVLATTLVVLMLGWCLWLMYKSLKIASYRLTLAEKGFPATYVEPLARLQFSHPNWVFELLPILDIDWNEVMAHEKTPSWNLVVYANWAPEEWNRLKEKNYTPYYAKDAKAYDSGAWYQASDDTIAYFLDPRNFLNEREIFMFETLGYDAATQTRESVERVFANTFMSHACYDGGTRTFAELVTEIGRKTGVSPVFLAGRLASEQGGGSVQAFGTIGDVLERYATNETEKIGNAVIWGKRFSRGSENTEKVMAKGKAAYNGFYNFYNFRAYGTGLFEIKYNAWVEATADDTVKKYLGPWTTQEKAIAGGSLKIKERYIDTHRHTRYLQKFSVLKEAGDFRWKQYMQNIAAPLVEARNAFKAYSAAKTLDAPYRFLIPVYREMPRAACPDPAGGQSVYSSNR